MQAQVTKQARAQANAPTVTKAQAAAKEAKKLNGKTTRVPSAAAKGAVDGQPHTKRAVAEAAKRERQPWMADEYEANRDAEHLYMLEPKSGRYYWWNPKGKAEHGAAAKIKSGSVQVWPQPEAKKAERKAKSAPKTERKASAPKPAADRAYAKGTKAVEAKDGSWRKYMLDTIRAHKSTNDAKAAHKASGQFAGQALDFNWAAKEGYITWK